MYNATLNDKNENTKKIIHIMVTTLCNRNCKFCCNKMYNLNDIPYVSVKLNLFVLRVENLFYLVILI